MAITPQSKPMNVYKQDVARLFLDSLKAVGINFAVLIPDTILYALDELLVEIPTSTRSSARGRTRASVSRWAPCTAGRSRSC